MTQQLKQEAKDFKPLRSLIIAIVLVGITYGLTFLMPESGEELGAWSLLPALFLIVYIFATKRILESLILASVMGLVMAKHTLNVVTDFSDTLTEVMCDGDTVWLIIVCGTMGSIIALIEKAGGAYAFGQWAASKAKSEKSALMWTWVLGIIIFMDDYLNSMTVGSCMTRLTDKYKAPREMLSYVVDSTAAPLCVLIPISTWAAFCGSLLVSNGVAPEGEGLVYFIKTIPYNFYGWFAAIVVPLVILGVIPKFGPMKKAYQRVAEGGPLAPEGSEKIDLHAGEEMTIPDKPRLINMIVPVVSLVGFTIYFDIEMQMGVLCTVVVLFIFYLAQNLMTADEFADQCIKGLQNMILPLMLMVLAYVFAAVNDEIGFTAYVIGVVIEHVGVAMIPFAVFCTLAVTEFITGTNWGMYIIALPIVVPIAMQTGAPMELTIAAVLSAGVLGSHCCFYSDATVLTSAACGCENFRHAITQAPYGIMCGIASAIMFLITGFVMG